MDNSMTGHHDSDPLGKEHEMTPVDQTVAVEDGAVFNASRGGFHRQPSDVPDQRVDTRGMDILRRKLAKKQALSIAESDTPISPDMASRVVDSTEENFTKVMQSPASISGDGSYLTEIDWEIHDAIFNKLDLTDGVRLVPLKDSGSEYSSERGLRRRQALVPSQGNRNMSPIHEKPCSDSNDDTNEAEEDEVVLQGTPEKRRGFHLPNFRKLPKKISPRNVIASSETTTQTSSPIDEFEGTYINQHNHIRPLTGLRERKAFSVATSKASSPQQHGQKVDDERPNELRKRMNRMMIRGPKLTDDQGEVSPITPATRRLFVAEKVRRTLKTSASRDSSDSIDFEVASSSDETDSDFSDHEDSSHITRNGDVDDTRSSQYDGSAHNAADLTNMGTGSQIPIPGKDGFPFKPNRPKDRRDHRVKPYQCYAPHKVFLSEEEIYRDMLQPSEVVEHLVSFIKPWYRDTEVELSEFEKSFWGTPHDGRIGSLRVEVLTCVGVSKHKADISVYLICGDSAFSTDVINGCRSPMWPSRSKRAACFPIFHAYARLYIGVFDVTSRKQSENDLFCGRVEIDIASLRPDSEYDVTLPIRQSSFIYDRRPRGVVRLRLGLHWFSERAAVLSYLSTARTMASVYHNIEAPSIPCADPKTFRNVAVTIHGPELPGKYSHNAFQATMREFNLYQLNFQFLAKQLLRDAVFYVNPLVSMYIFGSWMHCLWSSSLRLIPVYFCGFLIVLLLDGYYHHGMNSARNLGYDPVTLQEILWTIFSGTNCRKMRPLKVDKKTRTIGADSSNEIELLHHLEFPFSDGNEYKKRNIEDAVIKRSASARREKGGEHELHGRLSIYVKQEINNSTEVDTALEAVDATEVEDGDIGFLELDSDQELEIHEDVDNVFDLNALHEDEEHLHSHLTSSISLGGSCRSSVILGPPQDVDVRPKKRIPPQVHLARLEEKLHKFTLSLSMDKVIGCTLAYRPTSNDEAFRSIVDIKPSDREKQKGRRIPLDEFDKKLGYRNRHKNPVTELKSSFLGPLMRIFRILCCIVRIVFNVGIWSDPFLSFWVLCFLIITMLVLLVFPWRLFFFVIGVASFGPQNMLIRKRMELKAASQNDDSTKSVPFHENEVEVSKDRANSDDKSKKRRSLQNAIAVLKERRQKRLFEKQELQKGRNMGSCLSDLEPSNGSSIDTRRSFSASGLKAPRKTMEPREVIVPYSQFRKERFFDWPPDPTVARVHPVGFDRCDFDMSYGSLSSERDEDYSKLCRATVTGGTNSPRMHLSTTTAVG